MQVTIGTAPTDVAALVGGPFLVQNLGPEDVWADVETPTAATGTKLVTDAVLDWPRRGTGVYPLVLVTAANTADVRLLPLPE